MPDLSAAQFAELLTTMNVGSGVPCTRYIEGKRIQDPPDMKLEVEKVQDSFKQDMKDLAEKCDKDVARRLRCCRCSPPRRLPRRRRSRQSRRRRSGRLSNRAES